MSTEEKPVKNVRPENVKIGQEFAFDGVAVKLIELNRMKHKFGNDTFTVAYLIIDRRSAKVFESPTAHLFLTPESNVLAEMKKVVDLYETQREAIFNVKLPVVTEGILKKASE